MFIDHDLLKRRNFEPEEFFKSEIAKKHNINNYTDDIYIIENLSKIADLLQAIRDLLTKLAGHDCPLNIHSAYRNPATNKLVGGKPDSQHLIGCAVDFDCPEFGNLAAVFFTIKSSHILYDQLLLEKNCVHISVANQTSKNRKMAGKYIDNKFIKM
ncbi:MAG: peptidase M15 [Phage 33_17]|nr:MAG: peptidase M15 [Phage 33_17]